MELAGYLLTQKVVSPCLIKYHTMKYIPWLTKHHTTKTCKRTGGRASRILNLSTKWKWVVSFLPRPLYFLSYGPQNLSGCREKNPILPLLGIEPQSSS